MRFFVLRLQLESNGRLDAIASACRLDIESFFIVEIGLVPSLSASPLR